MSAATRVIVTRRLPAPVEQALEVRFDVMLNRDDTQFDDAALSAALRDADIVLCTLTDDLARPVFENAAPVRARLLAQFGVGYDNVDCAAARDAGIIVTNTPGVLTGDTADLTLLLLLAVARRATEGERELRSGFWTGWRPTHMLGRRVHGATLGIVGFGRIGQAVARRAHAGFGMRVLYHGPREAPAHALDGTGASRSTSLAELLAASDFVSLHCPLTPETRHLINRETLAQMKPHAFLVNASRGGLVDERALVDALREGRIAGAALDVFEDEPNVSPELAALGNVTLLPHLGSATLESRVAMGMRALRNIEAFANGEEPPDRVT